MLIPTTTFSLPYTTFDYNSALSKAKKSDTRIDSVIYDKTAIRIQGNAANYNSLLSYLSGFNKILHIKAKIRNTKSVQGRLKFSIMYNLMQ